MKSIEYPKDETVKDYIVREIPYNQKRQFHYNPEAMRHSANAALLVFVVCLVSYGIWALATSQQSMTVDVISYEENTHWSTYQKEHAIPHYGFDEDGNFYTWYSYYYTKEWVFKVEYTFVTNSTFGILTKSEHHYVDGYPEEQPDPSYTHYNCSKVSIDYWRGTDSVISFEPIG